MPNFTWDCLAALAERHGPSFFVAEPARFEENLLRLEHAFRSIYPRTRLGYSYKTNYTPSYIRRAHALGAYSEVVSQFELEIARALGIPGDRIIFNGPIKRREDLLEALGAGVRVNADSIAELRDLVELAPALREGAAIGVRCQLRAHGAPSRFGVDLRAREAQEALAAIEATGTLRLAGLHVHCSGDRRASEYRDRTRRLIELHRDVLGRRPLDYIDLGGGFAGPMSEALAGQLASPPASFEAYADAVAGEMLAAYGEAGPELILEPGMALLADTMSFVTRIEVVKLQGQALAVVDGSRFHIQPPWNLAREGLNVPMRVVRAPHARRAAAARWDIAGHTCIERDLLHQGFEGQLGVGDFLQFDHVGAYTTALSAPFIRALPPIVALDDAGATELLRPASTAQDLVRTYLPAGRSA